MLPLMRRQFTRSRVAAAWLTSEEGTMNQLLGLHSRPSSFSIVLSLPLIPNTNPRLLTILSSTNNGWWKESQSWRRRQKEATAGRFAADGAQHGFHRDLWRLRACLSTRGSQHGLSLPTAGPQCQNPARQRTLERQRLGRPLLF